MDPERVAHLAAIILSGHKEAHLVYDDPETIRSVVGAARAIIDEAHRRAGPKPRPEPAPVLEPPAIEPAPKV